MALTPAQSPKGRAQHVGTLASTTMRRRVIQSATLEEWSAVREAVEIEGCNVNIQDEETGLSLVHWAAHQGNEESLKWLIECGAFLRLKDKRGSQPLAGAKGATVTLLFEQAYSPGERVIYMQGTLDETRLEKELGGLGAAALNEPLWDEGGAVLAAVLAESHGADGFNAIPLLRWLTSRGADLEALDEDGNALLHMIDWSVGATTTMPLLEWALKEGHVEHKDLRNFEGHTPAMLCACTSPTGEDALCCLQLLDAVDANLSLANTRGMNTPMMLARYQGDGPWLSWCATKAGVDPVALCARGRTVADYLKLYGTEESEEEDEAT